MGSKKECPIKLAAAMLNGHLEVVDIACNEDDCAWWNADAEGCGIVRNLAPVQEYEGEDDADEPGDPFRVL